MRKEDYYVNGQIVKEQIGDYLCYYYKSGNLKAKGKYLNNMMEEKWEFFSENGSIIQIGNFLNNEKHGKWTRFDKVGNITYDENFSFGKKVES